MYTKKQITVSNLTFHKHNRSGLYNWGDLNLMTEKEVKEEIRKITGKEIDFDLVAGWNNLNRASMTFDFPREDELRALLGALNTSVITITKIK